MIEVGTQKAYTVQEAAELLNFTAQSVRLYIKKGKIKAQRVGNRYYIAEENIQSFLRGDSNDHEQKE